MRPATLNPGSRLGSKTDAVTQEFVTLGHESTTTGKTVDHQGFQAGRSMSWVRDEAQRSQGRQVEGLKFQSQSAFHGSNSL